MLFASMEKLATSATSAWIALRAEYGIAEGEADFAYNDVFPHDINFDQTGGVTFPKVVSLGRKLSRACITAARPAAVYLSQNPIHHSPPWVRR